MEPVFDAQSPPAAITYNNHIPQSVQSSPANHAPVTDSNHGDQIDHIDHDQHNISEPH